MLGSFCIKSILNGCLLVCLAVATHVQAFNGSLLKVDLREHTQFTLKVVPRLGSRLIFPFLLDDAELKPPLSYKLTNTESFAVTRDFDNLAGQNVFLITAKGPAGSIGKLYMSMDGYNLAINLIVSDNIKDHVSDISLDIGEEERNFLVSRHIDSIREKLYKEYERRLAEKDDLINEKEVARLMLRGVKKKNIKQLYRDAFKTADIYLDNYLYLSKSFYALHFWVEHYGKKFSVNSVFVHIKNKQGVETSQEGQYFCFERTRKLDECLYVCKNQTLIQKDSRLHITISTNSNEVSELVY